VVVALARARIPGLRDNKDAAKVADFDTELADVLDEVMARVGAVKLEEAQSSRRQMDEFLDRWRARAEAEPSLCYSDFDDPSRALLVDAAFASEFEDAEATMWSLRDVDKSSNLYLTW
jgi:hypothetical protein